MTDVKTQLVSGCCRDTNVHASRFQAKHRQLFEVPAALLTEKRDYWKEGAARESSGEGGNRPEDGTAEDQGLQSVQTIPLTGACAHARTDERPGEQARSRSRIASTDGRGRSEHRTGSKQRESLRGSVEGTSPTGRISSTHVDTTDADATGFSAAGNCTDGGHSTTRRNAVRGERLRETSEGRKKNLWVWLLQLQDEKANESVPRQVQLVSITD